MAKRESGGKKTGKPRSVKQLANDHKRAVKADRKKKAKKAAARSVEQNSVVWERMFALRDAFLTHDAKAKEHAKLQAEAEKTLKEAELDKKQHEKWAATAWDAKVAKGKCVRTCKKIVVQLFELMDSHARGEQLNFKVDIEKPADGPKAPDQHEDGTGSLNFPNSGASDEDSPQAASA